MLVLRELLLREIADVDGVDEVVEHLTFRALRDASELRELFVLEPGEALRDIARGRSRRVAELIAKSEVPRRFRP